MYKCELCGKPSQPGEPELRHSVMKPGGQQILREVKVCAKCSAELGIGRTSPDALRQRYDPQFAREVL